LKKKRGTELTVLVALGAVATCLFAVVAGLFAYEVADRRGLLASAAPLPTVATVSNPTPFGPTPRTITTTGPDATPTPRPTNTLVIPKETINDSLLEEIERKMQVIRNLPARQPVPKRFLTVDELSRLLDTWYLQDNPSDEVRERQRLYTALGFLGEGDDLNLIQGGLMARNLAGLYSSVDKQLFIVSERWNMTAAEEMTFAHEFTHALQDQHYDLRSLDDRAKTTDAALATLCLIEGDATLSMSLYAIGNLSQNDVDEMIYRAAQWKRDRLPVEVPLPIARMTLFPYTNGLRFVQALYQQSNDWALVNAAFAEPPSSTEQIMHVEKYLAGSDVPLPIGLPALGDAMGGSWREVDRGVLGEFVLSLHMEQGLSQADALRAAAGWAGDSYSLLVDNEERWLLVIRTAWDTIEDAQEFLGAYARKTSSGEQTEEIVLEENRGYWQQPGREIYVARRDTDALVIISPDRVSLDRALHSFAGF
jgi:hypothetical protein